jgi:hypothetical protein
VRGGTGLHANEARRQRREKLHHLIAAKLLPDNDLLGRIDAVDLKNVLGDIQTGGDDLYVDGSLKRFVCNHHLTAIRRRERAPSTTSIADSCTAANSRDLLHWQVGRPFSLERGFQCPFVDWKNFEYLCHVIQLGWCRLGGNCNTRSSVSLAF